MKLFVEYQEDNLSDFSNEEEFILYINQPGHTKNLKKLANYFKL